MNKKLQLVIQEYEKLKKQLIPVTKVTLEGDNLIFFQNQPLKELKDNQSINFENIGEMVEYLIKDILEYVESIKNLSTAINRENDLNKEYLIINTSDSTFLKLNPISPDTYYAYNLINYKDIAEFRTLIDQVMVKTNFILQRENGTSVNIEPIVMLLDASNKTIKRFTENLPFSITSIFSLILIGIKTKEKLTKDEKLKIVSDYSIELRFNSLKKEIYNGKLYDFEVIQVPETINEEVIFVFNLIDLFKNIVDVKTFKNKEYSLSSNNQTFGDVENDFLKIVKINEEIIPVSIWERIFVYKDFNRYKLPFDMKFQIYKSPSKGEYVYFPSGADLVKKLKETIDEI